jgi:hypothetical protein
MFQLLKIVVSKEKDAAAKNFARQRAWQDTLVRLLIADDVGDDEDDKHPPHLHHRNSIFAPTITENLTEEEDFGDVSESGSDLISLGSASADVGAKRPDSLPVSASTDLLLDVPVPSPSSRTPATPMFMRAQEFEDFLGSDDTTPERSLSASRSASTSAEDLSALSARHRRSSPRLSSANSLEMIDSPSSSSDLDVTKRVSSTELGTQHSKRASSVTSDAGSASKRSSSFDIDTTSKRASSVSSDLEGASRRASSVAENLQRETVALSEELCQNVLICLLHIMWKGVEGSDKDAWKVNKVWFYAEVIFLIGFFADRIHVFDAVIQQ